MQKGFARIIIILGIVLLLGIVGGAYYFGKLSIRPSANPKACTEEAKICSNGSSVGRTGPNCEFSPCPTANLDSVVANWKVYTNTKYNFSFQYPPDYKINETNISVNSKLESSAIILSVEPTNFTGSYVTEDPGIYFIVTRVDKNTIIRNRFDKSTGYEFIKVGSYEAAVKNILITSTYTGELPVGYKAKQVYIKKDDLIYEIESGNIHDPDSIIKIFDQVISTFKFTN